MEKKTALLSLTKNNYKTSAVLACIAGLGGRKQNVDGALHAQHKEGHASKTGLKSTFSSYSPFMNFQPL